MQVHRRKSSKEQDQVVPPPSLQVPTHSHSRTRSVSGPFTPTLSSPLASTFPSRSISFPSSHTAPELSPSPNNPLPSPKHPHRHSRLHSRNLSLFFPRPGSLPQSAIAEDGGQELVLVESPYDEQTPPPQTEKTQLDAFTFGTRPFPTSSPTAPSSAGPSRRGHHHKHSLSHNFFSFLDPGSQVPSPAAELRTQSTPTPVSPWNPISPFSPSSAAPFNRENGHAHSHSNSVSISSSHSHSHSLQPPLLHTPQHALSSSLTTPSVLALLQFILGASLWVTGQQIGSLACTGLGYWVVFDAMGVGVAVVLPGWLVRRELPAVKAARFYGNARVETVAMFAQAIYLMFAAVYVSKESVEHLLLSAGESALTGAATAISAGDGHHHHRGDEDPLALGIEFPVMLTFMTLLSVIFTAIVYGNHSKLVDISNNRIPIPTRIPALRSLSTTSPYSNRRGVGTSWWLLVLTHTLTNPYVAAQVCFCAGILCVVGFLNPADARTADLALATLEAAVTFKLAYRASVVLGTVLMQTAPARASARVREGGGGGKMEAFLRTMREIERHHQVLHLAAPHIWQLTPALSSPSPSPYLYPYLSLSHPFSHLSFPSRSSLSPTSVTPSSPHASLFSPTSPSSDSAHPLLGASPSLIATLELHVHPNLADEEALELTQWAWARCMRALNSGGVGEGGSEAEVTVGIVRG